MNRETVEESEIADIAVSERMNRQKDQRSIQLPGEMCMTKPMLLSVFGILLVLVLIQVRELKKGKRSKINYRRFSLVDLL